jgi:pilus assembly protein Flp/PilA
LRTLRKCERGATAIEYGLIAAMIVVAMMAGLRGLGGGVGGMWSTLSNTASDKM